MPIRVLDNQVIDQIAAGEVVDRPAHMIKELVENALDASATEIVVDFNRGGREVRIEDNGLGIPEGELPLALARHATSKIASVHDIWRIATYGFRGEALASIAAVSRLQIISRPESQETGFQISAEYGQLSQAIPVGAKVGTQIEIRGLFENVPARLKFLKSDSGETAAIKIQLKALALSRPDVTFRILQNGDFAAFWPAVATMADRVKQVLNEQEMYEGFAELDGFKAQVIISSPHRTVGNARQIWTLVQGRHVQDRGVQAAVMDAYRQLLMHGEFPVVVVDLRCQPDIVDVNVSPTKSQVKFRDSSTAFRVVHRAVRGILELAPWRPITAATNVLTADIASETETPNLISAEAAENLSFAEPALDRVQLPIKTRLNETQTSSASAKTVHETTERTVSPPAASQTSWASLEILGQAQQTYLLTQSRSAMIIVDQHAAHERVLFERLMRDVRNGSVEVQNFLLPLTVELSEEATAELIKADTELQRLGLVVELLGPSQIAVQAAPAIMPTERLPALIEKLADEYVSHGGSFRLDKALGDIVATMACHSAVRAGQSLSREEIASLLAQMDEFPLSSFCPHGRPVYVEYPFQKLERDFGRIV